MSRRRRREEPVEWNFFSFPVAFGFALGMFVGVLLAFPLGFYIFVLSLFLTSFGLAHIISRWLRRRTLDRQRQRDEEDEIERRALAARAAAQKANPETVRQPKRRRVRRNRSDA